MPPIGLLVLTPPYRGVASPHRWPLVPMGSVALVRTAPGLTPGAAELAELTRAAPWVPLAIELREGSASGCDRLHRDCRTGFGLDPAFVVGGDGAPPAAPRIIEAISRRRPPTAEQLGIWLAHRLGRRELAELLTAAIESGRTAAPPIHGRTVRRRLARLGLPRRLVWTRLWEIIRTERPPAAGPLAPERFPVWLGRLTGVGPRTWRERPGWEWMAERFVRRWCGVGYCNDRTERDLPAWLMT